MNVFTGDTLVGDIFIGTRRARSPHHLFPPGLCVSANICSPYSIVPNVLSVTGFLELPPFSSVLR